MVTIDMPMPERCADCPCSYWIQSGEYEGLMMCNALVGAADILLLFFLQAKLPESSIPGWALGIALLCLVQVLTYARMRLPQEKITKSIKSVDRSFLSNRNFWLGAPSCSSTFPPNMPSSTGW